MAIGKVSEYSNTFEVALNSKLANTNIDGTLDVTGNATFVPLITQTLDLNLVGTTYATSQEVALFNNGNITNAPQNDTVAILKCYSWSGNGDWCVQEWFGVNSKTKYIRYHQAGGIWTNWVKVPVIDDTPQRLVLYKGTINANSSINIDSIVNNLNPSIITIRATRANYVYQKFIILCGENGWVFNASEISGITYDPNSTSLLTYNFNNQSGTLRLTINNPASINTTISVTQTQLGTNI